MSKVEGTKPAPLRSIRAVGAAALSALLATGCAVPVPPSKGDATGELLAVDRAFADAARRDGIRAAFLAYAAPDATMFRDGVGPIGGPAGGVEAIAKTFDGAPPATLEWQPEEAIAAAGGDLGYTWGCWRYTPQQGDAKPLVGHYLTVWRRQPDGRWRWLADIGNDAAPPKRPVTGLRHCRDLPWAEDGAAAP